MQVVHASRLLVTLALAAVLVVGCSQGPLPGTGASSDSAPGTSPPSSAGLVEGTCWTDAKLGADPQDVLKLSDREGVPYLLAARAVADRPAFSERVDCAKDHAVEVHKVVRLPELEPRLTDYAALLKVRTKRYARVARSVARACMTPSLAAAVKLSSLPGAVMSPALPSGAHLGWAPASPTQWAKGQRVFACTLSWTKPEQLRYAAVFTGDFPTGRRTCIDGRALVFVDCARSHDRERIAVIEAREAVEAGAFPGPRAIRPGPDGRQLTVSAAQYARLDAACTAYLRSISTTRKLTGLANIDVDHWPTPTGSYPIHCEADRPTSRDPLVTQGSVYDR